MAARPYDYAMRRALLLFALLTGCGRRHDPITALPPVASTSASASPSASSSVTPVVVGPPCATPRIVVADTIEIRCWPDQHCKSRFSYAIENCTEAPVRLDSVVFKGGNISELVSTDFDPPKIIAARTRLAIDFPYDGTTQYIEPGDYGLVAAVGPVGDDAGPARAIEASFAIVDPGREKAKSECLARGDDWGAVGMFGTLRCAAVMKDEGKVCHDERECGGYCILEREVVVSTTEKQVTGRCTRTRERFGCNSIIGKTKDGKGLIPIHSKIPRMCVD
jgi:hypothetical protein